MLDVIQALDGAVLLWIQEAVRQPILNSFFVFYTQLGNAGLLWIVVSLVMLLLPKTRKAGFWALCAMALGVLCTNIVLKHLIARPRPYLVVEGLAALLPPDDPYSFPSGHATAAFAAAGIWCRMLPQRWMGITGAVLAVLMALSRLYVGVHFPTDVLAGLLIGLLCSYVMWVFIQKREKRRGELR